MSKKMSVSEILLEHRERQDLLTEQLSTTYSDLPDQKITAALCEREGLPYDADVATKAALSPKEFDLFWCQTYINNVSVALWGPAFPTQLEQLDIMTKLLIDKYRAAIRERLN